MTSRANQSGVHTETTARWNRKNALVITSVREELTRKTLYSLDPETGRVEVVRKISGGRRPGITVKSVYERADSSNTDEEVTSEGGS